MRTDEDRYWPKMDKNGPIHPTLGSRCWLWLGGVDGGGYGLFFARSRRCRAHRYSFEHHGGPITGGLWVLHHCDNPPCTNPDHLFLGTRQDNIADAVAKRRHGHGERHQDAKLNAETVRAIRTRHANGETMRALAREFGVDRTTVKAVVRRHTWAYVE